jgi:hypothetical protein
MENEADMEEFDREVAMLVKLTHPNVLCIFGTSSDPDGAMYQVLTLTGDSVCSCFPQFLVMISSTVSFHSLILCRRHHRQHAHFFS